MVGLGSEGPFVQRTEDVDKVHGANGSMYFMTLARPKWDVEIEGESRDGD